jgi:DNA-binding transcriptional LysR family regulator
MDRLVLICEIGMERQGCHDLQRPLRRSCRRSLDAAVRLGFLRDASSIARRIYSFRGKFVASPAYIAAHGAPHMPDDLLIRAALMQGTEVWRIDDRGKAMVLRPRSRVKSNNGKALLAALAGLGVAGLPDFLTETHLASGALT